MRRNERDKRVDRLLCESVQGFRGRILLVLAGNVLGSAIYMVTALLTRGLIDAAVAGVMTEVWQTAALLAALMLGRTAMNYGIRRLEGSTKKKAVMRLRLKVYGELLGRKQASLAEYHSAALLDRLLQDAADVVHFRVSVVSGFIGTLAGFAFAVWALAWINWLLPAVFIAVGLCLSILGRFFQLYVKKDYQAMRAAQEKTGVYYQETLANTLMLKVFGAQRQAGEQAENFEKTVYSRWRRWFSCNQLLRHGVQAFFGLGYLGALVFCAVLLVRGTITFGGMTAILQLVGQIQDPFSSVGDLLSAYSVATAAGERLCELEDLPSEEAGKAVDGWALYDQMAELRVRDVSFVYDREPVLVHASATLKKGDFVAVAGISGAGKSTLLKLLLGVYEDHDGVLELVRTDGSTVPLGPRTRTLFAYVPQKNTAFSGTVRENLTFLCGEASDEELWKATRLADAEEFLRAMPDGLDTVLGERGQGLSEGQTQRLIIARALLVKAPILVLDEATSALDEATEARVLRNIRAMGDITLLIISNRQAAFGICSREWRVTDGRIEERLFTS